MILRGLLVDGKPDTAVKAFRDGLKIYPLARAGDPPAMEFIGASGLSFNHPLEQLRLLHRNR